MMFADYMLGLLFYPEDGGNTFLRNVSELYGVASQKILLFIVTAGHRCENVKFDKSPLVCTDFKRVLCVYGFFEVNT
jgi:hypothetical protein